jgi:hypothetical protein
MPYHNLPSFSGFEFPKPLLVLADKKSGQE